jgi:hypothetical protein
MNANKMIFLTFFFIVGLLLVGFVNAAVYYASPNNLTIGNGSLQNPWGLRTGLLNIQAGDTLNVLSGTIINADFSISSSGTSENNRIIVQAYDSNNKPVLIGSNNSVTQVLSVNGNYVTVKDFVIKGNASGRRTIRIQGDYVTLDGVESYYIAQGESSSNHNINAYSAKNLVIRNSLVDNSPRNGIYLISSYPNGSADNCLIENTEIRYVTTHHPINIFPNTGDTTVLPIKGCIIRNNYIHDGGGQSAFFVRNFEDFQIYNNVVINMGNGLSISSGNYGQDAYDAHGSFTNNIIVVNNGYGVMDWTANYLTIKNNIFYGTFYSNQVLRFEENYLDADSDGVPIIGHDIGNNIYYNTSGQLRFDWGTNTYTGLSAWQSAAGHDTNSMHTDPLFSDITRGLLSSNSPAVDAGVVVLGYNNDYNNKLRTGNWDIGAYEINAPVGGGGGSYHPADTNQDNCISLGEISVYVGLWLGGNSGVTLTQVSNGVSTWMQGC